MSEKEKVLIIIGLILVQFILANVCLFHLIKSGKKAAIYWHIVILGLPFIGPFAYIIRWMAKHKIDKSIAEKQDNNERCE